MIETPPRLRDPERTRLLLLRAGELLFAERGLDGASTDDIARHSGVNKAMINYHFGGKEQLYATILRENVDRALERLEELAASDLPGEAKLRDFIRIFSEIHLSRASLSSMILREVLAGGRVLDQVFPDRIIRVFRVLGEILAQGAREGSLRAVSPMEPHLAMMGALLFFFATRPFRERMSAEGKLPFGPVRPEAFVTFLQDLMVRGLATPPASGRASRGRLSRGSTTGAKPRRSPATTAQSKRAPTKSTAAPSRRKWSTKSGTTPPARPKTNAKRRTSR